MRNRRNHASKQPSPMSGTYDASVRPWVTDVTTGGVTILLASRRPSIE